MNDDDWELGTDPNNCVLKLNEADSRAFVEAILNPKEPNETLKKAAAWHQQAIKISPVNKDQGME
jgi:Protein of unknown function (DUF1778)